jgi:hypothetical protein
VLERLGIAWKRGRDHVHSPDPLYREKIAFLDALLASIAASRGAEQVVFLDEFTYFRHPTVSAAWEESGPAQPLAHRGPQSNTTTRVIGALEAFSGKVHFWQGAKTQVPQFVSFYRTLCQSDPSVKRWWVIQDNWPLHFHPDLLVALEAQERSAQFRPCPHWKQRARRQRREEWAALRLPIQIVPLPTYAPWTNPIEKLWRWGRQEVLHLHRFSDQLPQLRERFRGFLEQFAEGSPDLLRYVGLSDPIHFFSPTQTHLPRGPALPY